MTGKITIGILINLILAAWLVVALRQRSPAPAGIVSPAQTPIVQSADHLTLVRTKVPRQTVVPPPSGLPWTRLASTDLKQYVANLRKAQCPEETIRDIIVAEVNRRFAAREKALKLKAEDVAPWEVANLQGAVAFDRQREIRALWNEKRALLKDLLGVEIPLDSPAQLAKRYREFEKAFQELPDDAREAVRSVYDRYWTRMEDFRKRTLGYTEPEDREDARRMARERNEELAKLLTPQQLENFELKTSELAKMMKRELVAFEASDDEFRAMFRLAKPMEDAMDSGTSNPIPFGDMTEAERQRMQQTGENVEKQMKVVLGETRFAEFERAQNGDFKTLYEVARQAGLPKETAIKAFELQKAAQAEAGRLLNDPKLPADQHPVTLEKLQTDLDQSLAQILGDKNLRNARNRGLALFYSPPPNRSQPRPTANP